ncbi:creatininase family protein [Phaeobacter sp. QD34_3]|uniref:creatininase family protein n=1 Tax=unclassified Phaeobacter TaxID=2621772 RepID=UPI00237F37C1|nr:MULTISPECIES: creatininase family protein [unclassified Phaeobacter]MDE4133357.1 creatininase family protein [Phaeobacter sp. QD34_3]MDE4136993.1 creatininase family protein [Phaeobacter sp. QD34_24]
MRQLDWADRRAPDFKAINPETDIAILPTAAIEQHGPHLPVGTDTMIMSGMLDAFRATCPEDLDPWILPIQAVGKSNEHLWAQGTLTLTAATALAAWTEIGLSVARAGFKKIVIINSHGGNLDLISILSRELRVQAGMLAVKCQWGSFGYPEGLYGPSERAFGIHGGDIETSLMLAMWGDRVDMSKARDFKSQAESDPIAPTGAISRGWIASDLNPDGTVGDASAATADKGYSTRDHQVAGFIDLLRQVREMPVPTAPAALS